MDQIIQDILTEEEEILNCIKTFFCATSVYLTPEDPDTVAEAKEKVDVVKSLLCAMSSKERAVADVLDGSSNVLLADKGISPNGGNADQDICCGC